MTPKQERITTHIRQMILAAFTTANTPAEIDDWAKVQATKVSVRVDDSNPKMEIYTAMSYDESVTWEFSYDYLPDRNPPPFMCYRIIYDSDLPDAVANWISAAQAQDRFSAHPDDQRLHF